MSNDNDKSDKSKDVKDIEKEIDILLEKELVQSSKKEKKNEKKSESISINTVDFSGPKKKKEIIEPDKQKTDSLDEFSPWNQLKKIKTDTKKTDHEIQIEIERIYKEKLSKDKPKIETSISDIKTEEKLLTTEQIEKKQDEFIEIKDETIKEKLKIKTPTSEIKPEEKPISAEFAVKSTDFVNIDIHKIEETQKEQDETKKSKEGILEECDGGLIKLVVPIFMDDEFVGVVGGCGLLLDEGEVDTFYIARTTDLEEEKLTELAYKIKTFTTVEAEATIAYITNRLKEIISKNQSVDKRVLN